MFWRVRPDVVVMIEVAGLTCRRGRRTTVDDLSFRVETGQVTGFLGPNGAGKSTTMKMIAGMLTPTSGTATVAGVAYRELRSPIRHLGVLLDPSAVHPQRSAVNHLRMIARTASIPRSRVDTVLDMAGLTAVAGQRIGQFSLGMRQRLGIATALLGDPGALMLDEPVNGLDPDGVIWLRTLLRQLAGEGRAVVLSSHLIAEIEVTADRVIVIGQGRKLADAPLSELHRGGATVSIGSPDIERLLVAMPPSAQIVSRPTPERAIIGGIAAAELSTAAFQAGVILHELTTNDESLETTFQELTANAADFTGSTEGQQ